MASPDGIGSMVAKKLPPPGKLKGYKPGDDEDIESPAEDEAEGGEWSEVADALESNDPGAGEALCRYLEAAGFVKK